MIAIWVPITLAAALLQNIRTVLQRRASENLSTAGTTFVRFLYGAPPATLYLFGLSTGQGVPIPPASGEFLLYALVGGVGQILGNALLIRSFRYRNFLVATAYSKTEVAQTALYSALWLREAPTVLPGLGILISMAGVVTLSLARGRNVLKAGLGAILEGPALMGLGVGAGYAASAVCYRAAALSLDSGDVALRAATTLLWVMGIQIAIVALYLLAREPAQLPRIWRCWRIGAPIGFSGALASACWFTAMSLENVAYVRALGQVELLFTYFSSRRIFNERSNFQEILGIGLTLAGILLVLLGQ